MRLAHFEILERIGHGGMGVVYRARDTHLGRTAAIKVLPPAVSSDLERRSRFLREAQAAANLNHPNIATVYQFGTATTDDPEIAGPDGPREVLFLAMELVEGEDLQAKLHRSPIEPSKAFSWGVQIADGLAAAHEAGVVHRDLKPNNIRITHDGRVKLLDFGLAKVREGTLSPPSESVAQMGFQTSQGMLLGTPPYMAPEQLRGSEVDERCDLYALGVVLFQMVAGEPPYPTENLLEYVKALANTKPKDLAELNAAVTEDQEAVISKLLAQDPEKRYQQADVAAQDLRAVGGLSPSTPVTMRRRANLPKKSHRPRLVGVLVGLALLALLIFLAPRFRPESDKSSIAILTFVSLNSADQDGREGRLITEEIYDHLSIIEGLTVFSPTEAEAHREQGISGIGRELEAATVLEGNVRSSETGISLTARVLDAATATPIWRQVYSEPSLEALFRSSEKIARDLRLVISVWQEVGGRIQAIDISRQGSRRIGQLDINGDAALAMQYFTLALEIDSSLVAAYSGRSLASQQVFNNTGDQRWAEQSLEDARLAVSFDANDAMARLALGRAARMVGDFPEAEKELLESLRLDPGLDLALLELAVVHQVQGKLDRAAAMIRRAVEQRPDFWDYWNQLGVILWQQEDFAGAEEAFQKAHALAPEQATWTLGNLVGLALQRGDLEKVLELAQGAPNPLFDAGLASNLGTAYFFMGEYEKSESFYRTATQLEPARTAFHHNLGDALHALGRQEEALEEFRFAAELLSAQLEKTPNMSNGMIRLALYLAKAGECEKSLEIARGQSSQSTASLFAAQSLAEVFFLCGRKAQGQEALKDAIALGLSPARAEEISKPPDR